MRDEKDPGTIEMPLSRRRGRPPNRVTGETLTRAMRMRVYRKTKARKVREFEYESPGQYSDAVLLDALRDDIRRSDAEGVRIILAEIARRHG